MPIIEGYLIGLAMIVFIGPVFFTLSQSALEHGSKTGFAVALGIFTSDVLIVLLCSVWAIGFFENPEHQKWLAGLGSLVLLLMGIKYILKPKINFKKDYSPSALHLSSFFIKGFVVNFANPFVFIIWISIIAYSNNKYPNPHDTFCFLLFILLGIITTDCLKVVLVKKINNYLSVNILKKVFFVTGLVLIFFSFRLLYFIVK